MAILKSIRTPQGVDAMYHRLEKLELSASRGTLEAVIAMHATREAREAGAVPLWHEYVCVPIDALTEDPRAALYRLLGDLESSPLRGGESDEPPADAETLPADAETLPAEPKSTPAEPDPE